MDYRLLKKRKGRVILRCPSSWAVDASDANRKLLMEMRSRRLPAEQLLRGFFFP
jgi:hypothetical protein